MPEPKPIAGRYQILSELGHGGFATVYRAHDTRMGREIALKIIRPDLATDPAFVERFQQEARTAANLRHPNIVPVYDFGDTGDGSLYLAMALIGQGHTLRDLLAKHGPLLLEKAISILTPLAAALDYLHHRNPPLVHRDVKPANVLLDNIFPPDGGACPELVEGDKRGEIVLTDFGLVRSLEASTQLTQSGTILGTPAYLAPEQADPKQWGDVTPLTDVYALGIVAYEALTGRTPFQADTPLSVLRAHADLIPPSPLEFAPTLGQDLADVLTRALAKPPDQRYPSAGALVAALRQVIKNRTLQEKQQSELAQLLAQAQSARETEDWLTVQAACVRVMQIDRAHPDALEMMAEATAGLQRESAAEAARRQRAQRYEEGEQALAAEQWQAAIAAFEAVAEGNPDFRDVQDKLAHARDELQRTQWYDEAIAHAEAERWPDACRAWLDVLRGRPDYRELDAATRLLDATSGLLQQYDALWEAIELDQRERKQTGDALLDYEALMKAFEEKEWGRVIELGEPLLESAPDLERPVGWIVQARVALSVGETPSLDRMIWEQDGKEMVRIPAGKFLYGDKKEERELPEFWIDKTPVTNAEFARFVEATDHEPPEHWEDKTPPRNIADHPVVNVSWNDAVAYAEWAGKRLPTEEEWEKAARSDDGREYPWGNWKEEHYNSTSETGIGTTTPVGQYSPDGDSPYSCVDMAGNVWEWTASDYSRGRKVLRGGSFYNEQRSVRASSRNLNHVDSRNNDIGFRCALATPGQ